MNREQQPLIGAYEHRRDFAREAEALHMLRKLASLVKPIMRKRNWFVRKLVEFYPEQHNLLGLNINRGESICLRLRYPGDVKQFMPLEQITDTLLHELSHIVHGPHDAKFHALWNELRQEHQALVSKGYSGDGFLSDGHKLGGKRVPMNEVRRQARAAAEKRRVLHSGSGQRLGGAPIQRGADIRAIIADAAARRMNITQGCASGTKEAGALADQASRNGFKTKALEDEANERAMAQALWELVQEEEARKVGATDDLWTTEGLTWKEGSGLEASSGPSSIGKGNDSRKDSTSMSSGGSSLKRPSEDSDDSVELVQFEVPSKKKTNPFRQGSDSRNEATRSIESKENDKERPVIQSMPVSSSTSVPAGWACTICTLVNPPNFLCCDACGVERTSSEVDLSTQGLTSRPAVVQRDKPLGWNCHGCGTFMETQWWTCSACGRLKSSS